jgi:hypothetical protein
VPDVFIDIALPSRAGRLELPPCTKRARPLPREKRASPQLIRRCDCNDKSSPVSRHRRLDCNPKDAAACSGRAGVKQPHHFSAPRRRQLENGQIDAGINWLVGLTNPRCRGAGMGGEFSRR